MKFSKMHSLGNDYIFINRFEEEIENPRELARILSHRRFGIGSDGLLLVEPSMKALFKMRMFNADGSEAEMCGNGLRCFGKYVYEQHLTQETNFWVETGAGLRHIELEVKNGEVVCIQADMGKPILERSKIPMLGKAGPVLDEVFSIQEHIFQVSAISMGNPHLVIFVEQLAQFPVHYWGPLLEKDFRFPHGVNVEFAERQTSSCVFQRTWERGCGETYACGTGACAVSVASMLQGRCDSSVDIHLRGGVLKVVWDQKNSVFLSGPASWIYEGTISANWLQKMNFIPQDELFLC
ncbi:MAG: diaminopimelate epimerase [Planctomycetota bacterium]